MTESRGSQSFGPESTNPRLRRAYADAKLVQLGKGAASYRETQIAVNAAIGTRKGQAAQFEHRYIRAASMWSNLLREADSTGKELAGPGHTVDEIVQRAEDIATEHRGHDLLVQTALWNVVAIRSWNKDIPVEAAIDVAKRMTPDRYLGNSLADVGKYLGEERGMEERGYAVLDYAAEVFTTVWDKAKDEGKLSMDLFEDYARVAGLQDWAGDPEGAHITAQAVVPRLLEWEETGALEDEDDHHLDCSKEELLAYLGDPQDSQYIRLYNTLRTVGARQRVNSGESADDAMELVANGREWEGFGLVAKNGGDIPFSFLMIDYLYDKIESGDTDAADELFRHYQSTFPEEFEGHHSVELGMSPLIDVLVGLGKNELLASMIVATTPEDEDNRSGVEVLAGRAGVVFAKDGSKDFGQFKDLLPEPLKEKAQEGFDIVKKHQSEQSSI